MLRILALLSAIAAAVFAGDSPSALPDEVQAALADYRRMLSVIEARHAASAAGMRQQLAQERAEAAQTLRSIMANAIARAQAGQDPRLAGQLTALQRDLDEALRPGAGSLRLGTLTTALARRAGERDWIVPARTALAIDQPLPLPGTLTVVAKANDLDLRIAWVMDQIIFNWESDPNTLVVTGLTWNETRIQEQGWINPGEWHRIQLAVTADALRVLVNGQERARLDPPYAMPARNPVVFAANSDLVVADIIWSPSEPAATVKAVEAGQR